MGLGALLIVVGLIVGLFLNWPIGVVVMLVGLVAMIVGVA